MDWMQLLHIAFRFDHYVGDAIAMHSTAVYLVLFAVVFCEFGFIPLFFLPGNPLIFTCGAFAATGLLNAWTLIPLLAVAVSTGSMVNYWSGRAIGRRVTAREHSWLNPAALHKTHVFYEKHGGITFLLSPFIGVVRTFAPFVAGLSGMTFRKYIAFVFSGAMIWVASLVTGGYFLGDFPLVREHMSSIAVLGVALALAAIALGAGWKYFSSRNSKRHRP